MKQYNLVLSLFLLVPFFSCNDNKATGTPESNTPVEKNNHLSMSINGVEWKADNNIWGAFHPKGQNKTKMKKNN